MDTRLLDEGRRDADLLRHPRRREVRALVRRPDRQGDAARGQAAEPDEAQAIYDGQPARVGCTIRMFAFGNIDVEFLQPGPEKSAWRDLLEEKGPGCHHIAFRTRNLTKRNAYLEEQGPPPAAAGRVRRRPRALRLLRHRPRPRRDDRAAGVRQGQGAAERRPPNDLPRRLPAVFVAQLPAARGAAARAAGDGLRRDRAVAAGLRGRPRRLSAAPLDDGRDADLRLSHAARRACRRARPLGRDRRGRWAPRC